MSPRSKRQVVAGRVNRTRVAEPSAGRETRIGATPPPTAMSESPERTRSWANSSTSTGAPDGEGSRTFPRKCGSRTSTVTVGEPASTKGVLIDPVANFACCAGCAAVPAIPLPMPPMTESTAPIPGSDESVAGSPPGGFTTMPKRPFSGSFLRLPPFRPGYRAATRVSANPRAEVGTVNEKGSDEACRGDLPRRWAESHSSTTPAVPSVWPPSCPPANQDTVTGAPAAAIARSFASDWSSPKSVSCRPCRSRVGAVMPESTEAGEDASRSVRSAASSCPPPTSFVYKVQSSAVKRPQAP